MNNAKFTASRPDSPRSSQHNSPTSQY
jgi:hypothetical protein